MEPGPPARVHSEKANAQDKRARRRKGPQGDAKETEVELSSRANLLPCKKVKRKPDVSKLICFGGQRRGGAGQQCGCVELCPNRPASLGRQPPAH